MQKQWDQDTYNMPDLGPLMKNCPDVSEAHATICIFHCHKTTDLTVCKDPEDICISSRASAIRGQEI